MLINSCYITRTKTKDYQVVDVKGEFDWRPLKKKASRFAGKSEVILKIKYIDNILLFYKTSKGEYDEYNREIFIYYFYIYSSDEVEFREVLEIFKYKTNLENFYSKIKIIRTVNSFSNNENPLVIKLKKSLEIKEINEFTIETVLYKCIFEDAVKLEKMENDLYTQLSMKRGD